MNERQYRYGGAEPTYHGTLGEIKPGVNTWPHLDHELIMAYGLVEEAEAVSGVEPSTPEPSTPDALEGAIPESPPASGDSSPSTRRRSGRHWAPEGPQQDEATEV